MSAVETVRWVWRQLTSMRTALVLLFLLAVVAVPGSVVPQANQDATAVAAFRVDHPGLSVWYDRLSLFSVYSSPWFAAVYLLLFTSLIGCIIPRTRVHLRALRSRPVLTPRVLARLPAYTTWTTAADPAQVLLAAQERLGRRHGLTLGHRLAPRPEPLSPVAAERGHLRETGNLVFHVALLVVLGGVAAGSLLGYRGTVIMTEGTGFSNEQSQYADLTTGALAGPGRLPPFSVELQSFAASFFLRGPSIGAPDQFTGQVRVTDSPGDAARDATLRLNHPVAVDGAQISLLGNGYAPLITVRDAKGAVLYSAPTVFLPQDADYTSAGAAKIPDARLEIAGFFLPTAAPGAQDSVFPGPVNPQLRLIAYRGTYSLGAGSGSVYVPDSDLIATGVLKPVLTPTGQPMSFSLEPGGTFKLPDGTTVSFEGFKRWANVQVDSDPGAGWVLGGSVAAVAGLCGSLFVRRRRWWVRAGTDAAGRNFVEVGGLDRNDSTDLSEEMAGLVEALHRTAPPDLAAGPPSTAAGPPSTAATNHRTTEEPTA